MRVKKTSGSDGGHTHLVPKTKHFSPIYFPKTENQKQYVDYLQDTSCSIVFGVGPAGTGKTMFACSTAINALKNGDVKKIILTRPIVPVEDEELGFLPGDLKEKMDPWTRPMFDIFLEYFPQVDLDSMVRNGIIEISPLAYMRGRTFKHSFIIADEMQNSTPNQMLMLTTRIGTDSKMVITGDLAQSDRVGAGSENGLSFFMKKIRSYYNADENNTQDKEIRIVELTGKDVERSPVVSKILDIYAWTGPAKPVVRVSEQLDPYPLQQAIRSERQLLAISNDAALIPATDMKRLL